MIHYRIWWYRLVTKLSKPQMYLIRYKGRVNPDLWTITEACKLMRVIPVKDSLELITEDGYVHFILPARKD